MRTSFAVYTSVVLLCALTAAGCSFPGTGGGCGSYRSDKIVRVGSHEVHAEVANTPAAQQKGLGGRKCIGPDQAMLFEFQKAGLLQFWMKGMRFPIDMVWLDPDRRVVWVERNVSPDTYPMNFFNRGDPAQYVLELKAGNAKELGLKVGSTVSF